MGKTSKTIGKFSEGKIKRYNVASDVILTIVGLSFSVLISLVLYNIQLTVCEAYEIPVDDISGQSKQTNEVPAKLKTSSKRRSMKKDYGAVASTTKRPEDESNIEGRRIAGQARKASPLKKTTKKKAKSRMFIEGKENDSKEKTRDAEENQEDPVLSSSSSEEG